MLLLEPVNSRILGERVVVVHGWHGGPGKEHVVEVEVEDWREC